MEAKIETKIEARRRLHIKAKTLPNGEGFVIVTSRFRATTRRRPMVFLLAFPVRKASHFDQCLLLPTKAKLLWDFAVQSTAYTASLTHVKGVRVSTGSRLSLVSGDHIGSPLRCPFRNVDFTGLPQRQNTPYLVRFSFRKSIASLAVLPISHKSRAFMGTLVRFVGKRRCRRPKRRFFAGKPSNWAVHRRRVAPTDVRFKIWIHRAG